VLFRSGAVPFLLPLMLQVGFGMTAIASGFVTFVTSIGASDGATGGSGFVDGIQTAFALDAAIAVGGFLVAAFLIGGRAHLPHMHRPSLAGHSPRGHGP